MPPAIADAIAALSTVGGLSGLAAVLTAVLTGRRHTDDVKAVRAQLEPDHGTSVADAVCRIERDVGGLRADIRLLRADHEERLRRLEDNDG